MWYMMTSDSKWIVEVYQKKKQNWELEQQQQQNEEAHVQTMCLFVRFVRVI